MSTIIILKILCIHFDAKIYVFEDFLIHNINILFVIQIEIVYNVKLTNKYNY